MVNMLVVEDNYDYSKNLINIILQELPQIRLCKIATDGKDALNFLINSHNRIDIILLDLQIPNISGIKILETLENNNINKYKNSVIVITGQLSLLNKIVKNSFLYTYIPKTDSIDNMISKINELTQIKQKELLQKNISKLIDREMHILSFKESLIGTKYLRETINLIAKTPGLTSDNLKNKVYPLVAKKYKKTTHNIKCNINNATELMNCTCEKNVLKKYFMFYDDISNATPKQVIDTILNKIGKAE